MTTLTVSLPVADRVVSSSFYRQFLERPPLGTAAEDGEPEPLVFAVTRDTSLFLIPSSGFGAVIGADHDVANPPQAECLLGLLVGSPDDVRERAQVASRYGGSLVVPAAEQDWGFGAVVSDPDGHLWEIHAESA